MGAKQVDEAMRAVAQGQHGALSVDQATAVGATRSARRHRCESGEWELVTPRVLRMSGSLTTFERRCSEAVLDVGPGAALSHETAMALYGLPGFTSVGVHVSRQWGHSCRPSPLGRLHLPTFLPERHWHTVRGLAVATVARAIFDCAGYLHPLRVERALDNALSRELVGLEAVRRMAIELCEHGRTGSTLMRQLLEARGAAYVPPDSSNEARWLALLIGAGVDPLPEQQVQLGIPDVDLWKVDFFDRQLHLITEIDGDLGHTSHLDRLADARRDRLYRAAGFGVLRIGERLLKDDPGEALRRYLAERRARLAA